MLGRKREQPGGALDAAERKIVLVVAAESHIARLVAVNLRRTGCEAILTYDGQAALDEVRACRPDGIVLDAKTSGLSGWEVFERLQADPDTRHIPVLMIGAEVEPVPTGMPPYRSKPFTPPEMRRFMKAILEHHRVSTHDPDDV